MQHSTCALTPSALCPAECPTSRERTRAFPAQGRVLAHGPAHRDWEPAQPCGILHRAHRAARVRFPSGVAAASEEAPGEAEGLEESWIPLGSRDEFSCVHSCSCYHGTSAESDLGRKDEIRMFCFLLLGTQHWRCGTREILLRCARGARVREGLGESRGVLEAVPPGKGDTHSPFPTREETVPLLLGHPGAEVPGVGTGDATSAAVP